MSQSSFPVVRSGLFLVKGQLAPAVLESLGQ